MVNTLDTVDKVEQTIKELGIRRGYRIEKRSRVCARQRLEGSIPGKPYFASYYAFGCLQGRKP